MQRFVVSLSVLLFVLVFASRDSAHSTEHRVQFAPHFVQGETVRYRIGTETAADEHTTTPIADSQQGSNFKQTTSFLIRLDVLAVQRTPSPNASSPSVRFRATFEESHSDSQTDASGSDPASLDEAIDKLAGHAVEFTLGGGSEDDVKGLDQLTTSRAAAQSALAWIPVLANAGTFPSGGIEIGQKWTNERPLSGFPLTGMTRRSESTYLRNEPCAPSSNKKAENDRDATQLQQDCAVVLTRFEMSRHGSEHADATPDDYRRNGLRTSGKWNVTGESLNSVSLNDGFLVTSTQTATQDIDYEIVSASSGSRVHQEGRTKTQTDINLVRGSAKESQ